MPTENIDEMFYECINDFIHKAKRLKKLDLTDPIFQKQLNELFHHSEKAIVLLQKYRMINKCH